MTYVVVSRNEDGVRVFGTFRKRAKADALAEAVNAEIEAQEETEFAAWQARENAEDDSMMPEGYGRCGVLIVHAWSPVRALRFALGHLDS